MEEIAQQNRESRTCVQCPKKVILDDIDSLNVHFEHCQKERPFQCELCGRGFRTKYLLTCHEKTRNRELKAFSCSLCKKRFHFRCDLSRHERTHERAKFICTDCGRSFRSKCALAAHCIKHIGQKPFKCSECQKKYVSAKSRNQHQFAHKAKWFTCTDCGKSYTRKASLMKHVQIRYGSSLKRRDSRRFCCDDCGYVYTQKEKSDASCEKPLRI